ncbi:MAG: anaerobic glycerol-3-phosphate dehydrogenase subunit C [Candidatus Dormibacterales bacterium]
MSPARADAAGPGRELDEVDLSADRCVKCNACNTVCPVMPVTDLFPGPKYCGPQAQRFRLGDLRERWVDYCSGCGACTRACPSGVKVAELNTRARARMYAERGGIPLRDRLLSSSELIGKVGSRTAPLANLALANPLLRAAAERVLGIHRDAPLPPFSRRTFRARFASLEVPARATETVAYFHACSTNYYEPWVGEAAVAVLARQGVRVELPDQGCCGLPFISNGDFETARRMAERNVEGLLPAVRAGLKVVGTSTSCTYTLKSEYREVLGMRGPGPAEVSAAVYDLFEFLRERRWSDGLRIGGSFPRRVLYHPPCQLRSHGVGLPAAELLAELEGIQLAESGVECCGIAGTYGLKAEKHEIARRVGEPLAARAAQHQAQLVACDSESCRWHIGRLTGLETRHPVEVLLEASR